MSTKSSEKELIKISNQKAALKTEISSVESEIAKINSNIKENCDLKQSLSTKIAKLRQSYKDYSNRIEPSLAEKFNLLYEFDLVSNEYELIKLSDLNDSNQKFSEILSNKINEFKPSLQGFLTQLKLNHSDAYNLRNEILINILKYSKVIYQIEILQNDLNDKSYQINKLDLKMISINELTKKINDFNNLKLKSFEDSGFETALSTPVQQKKNSSTTGLTHTKPFSLLDLSTEESFTPVMETPKQPEPTANELKRKINATSSASTPDSSKKPRIPNNTIWIGEPEDAFQKCFVKFYYETTRNSLMSNYIVRKSGKLFSNAQISDHVSKLKKKGMLEVPTREQSRNCVLDDVSSSASGITSYIRAGEEADESESEDNEGERMGETTIGSPPKTITADSSISKAIGKETPTGKLRWIGKLEEAFIESWRLFSVKPAHLRGSLISKFILDKTGVEITTKQISDHVRFLKLQNKLPSAASGNAVSGNENASSKDDAKAKAKEASKEVVKEAAEQVVRQTVDDEEDSSKITATRKPVWFGEIEEVFKKSWLKYGSKPSSIRSELIAKDIKDEIDISRSPKQISDHIRKSLQKGSISAIDNGEVVDSGSELKDKSSSSSAVQGENPSIAEDEDVDMDKDKADTDASEGYESATEKSLKSPVTIKTDGADDEDFQWNDQYENLLKESIHKFPSTSNQQALEISQYFLKKTGKFVSQEKIKEKLSSGFSLDEQELRYSKILNLDKYPPSNLWDFAKDKIILKIYEQYPKKSGNNNKISRMSLISDEILVSTGDFRTAQQVNKRVSTLRKRGETALSEILNN